MTKDAQYQELYNALCQYASEIKECWEGFTTGKICGYTFRLFCDTDCSWVGIYDETAKDGMVPAFYNSSEIVEWVNNHQTVN